MERAGHGLAVERTGTVGIEVRRERRPARGADQGVEVLGRHRRGVVDPGQLAWREQLASRFKLPEQALAVRRVVVLVLDLHQVQAARVTAVWVVEWLYGSDDAAAVADPGEHADARYVGACLCLLHSLPCWLDPGCPIWRRRVRRQVVLTDSGECMRAEGRSVLRDFRFGTPRFRDSDSEISTFRLRCFKQPRSAGRTRQRPR